MTRRLWFGMFVVFAAVLALPAAARAQSAITGTVRDVSGAVMPGVTVEVASPALIEKVRSVTTDGEGRYQVVDLRPGVYSITFSLTGFSTIKRDGLELPSNFTATVNGDLKVGSLEESITVSAIAPVVDVSNAVQQTVLSRAVLDNVPTGRSVPTLGALLSGARLALPDVGGTSGMQNRDLTVHGSDGRDTTFQVDGMTLNGIEGDGSVQSYFNEAMFEEITYQTSAINAETSAGGMRANMIPKDGGNTFKGSSFFSASNKHLQSDNSEGARAAGLSAPDALNKVWDFNVAEGGPIKKDKLWFFTSYRDWGVYQYIANSFFTNGDQTIDDASIRSGMVRLTTQLGKNKVAAYLDRIRKFRGHENSAPVGYAIAGEATDIRAPKQYYTSEMKWTNPMTAKLLFEAGLAINNESYSLTPLVESENAIPRRDTILQTSFGAYDGGVYYREPIRRTAVASLSYVTGSHAFKAGINYGWGYFWRQRREVADLIQLYQRGAAAQVIIHNTPQDSLTRMNADQGIFVQDSWTFGRVTLNPGVRFEHFNGSIDSRAAQAGRFVPFREFAEVKDYPDWNDVAPRFGMAWDIRGDGRTAVKVGVGRYMRAYSTGFGETYDPNFYASSNALAWTDLNADDIAQGTRGCVYRTAGCEIDFSTLAASFGSRNQNPVEGIQRPYQIETNVSVQRELLPGTSVTFSYFQRNYKDLIWTDNAAVDASDYTKFDIPDPRNNGQTLPVYNISTAKASAATFVDANSRSNYRRYSGYDINFNSRLKGLTLFGGLSLGHQLYNTCQTEDPNQLRFCDATQFDIPYYPQIKINGSYNLPWALSISGTFQSYAGDARNSTVDGLSAAASNGLSNGTIPFVDPSLRTVYQLTRADFLRLTGASLTQSTINIQLDPPGMKLLDRQNQLDIRLKRLFKVRGFSFEAQADAYNALNTGVVLTRVQTYGPNLDRPASILQGRLFRFGMQARW